MDWDAFRDQIEREIKVAEGLKLKRRIMKFNEVVIESAKVHVGKAKPGKRKRAFVSRNVKENTKIRNRYKRELKKKKAELKKLRPSDFL